MNSIHLIPKETNNILRMLQGNKHYGHRSKGNQCALRELVKELSRMVTAVLIEKGKSEKI